MTFEILNLLGIQIMANSHIFQSKHLVQYPPGGDNILRVQGTSINKQVTSKIYEL